ncbi:MAG: histidine phosphatase family protein [Verrucomicrobiota bacterium]
MSTPTNLFLVRHAEVAEAYHRVFIGGMDVELSALGHQQAQACAQYCRSLRWDAVYASPMKRVQQTMAPFRGQFTSQPEILNDLREVDVGEWTGLHWEEVGTRFQVDFYQWLHLIETSRVPGGESGPDFRERVERALDRIRQQHPGQQVAVFAHGGVIRMILAVLLGLPLTRTAMFAVEYAGLTEVALHPGREAEIQRLNFTPWKHF